MNIFTALVAGLLASNALAQPAVTLHHVHGLAYSADGKQLMIPSHHGLAIYRDGKWSKAPGLEHDYMGFSATARNVYSSGHPAPRSGLLNPVGLIRSRDGGKTWEKLGLEGETDFHLLSAGWNTNAIYVWNPAPSSRLKAAGLHFTLDDGRTWRRSDARGLGGELRALAAHPDEAAVLAVATSDGLYLSPDSGEQFAKAAGGGEGLSVLFDLNGTEVWYGSFERGAKLTRVSLSGGSRVTVGLPPLSRDAVAYIAQNPAERLEYAIATFERSVYRSKDAGRTWSQIADRGTGK